MDAKYPMVVLVFVQTSILIMNLIKWADVHLVLTKSIACALTSKQSNLLLTVGVTVSRILSGSNVNVVCCYLGTHYNILKLLKYK